MVSGLVRAVMLLLTLLLLSALSTPLRAQYLLQPGDQIGLSVLGVPALSIEADIDADSLLRLPQMEPILAEGLTVDELQEIVRARLSGQVFSIVGPTGSTQQLNLSGSEVFVRISAYRPITLYGAVARPGPVAYRPRLTLRELLATAGGAAVGTTTGADAVNNLALARLQAEYRTLTLQRASLLTRVWRLEEVGLGQDSAPPNLAMMGIGPQTAGEIIDLERQVGDLQMVDRERQRRFLTELVEQIDGRLAILREQEAVQVQTVQEDNEQMDRVQQLFSSGVVPILRVVEMRRAQSLSSLRLLETQNNIERVLQERGQAQRDLELLDTGLDLRRITDLISARADLRNVELRITALREQLVLSGQISLMGLDPIAPEFRYILSRGNSAEQQIDLKTVLLPGDIVEVRMDIASAVGN